MYMATEKVYIRTDSGEIVEAATPVILSASRSTDIPAFYAKWFFNRLAKGYCTWTNPFNQQKQYISFSKCKVIVFWTKIQNQSFRFFAYWMKWEFITIFK